MSMPPWHFLNRIACPSRTSRYRRALWFDICKDHESKFFDATGFESVSRGLCRVHKTDTADAPSPAQLLAPGA